MKEKFMRFMQGRNGVDQFARFTMGVALAAIVLTLFTGTRSGIGAFLDLFGMAAIVYTYFRDFFQKYFQTLSGESEVSSDDR